MTWDQAAAIITAFGSVASSVWVVKAIVRHEEKQCDIRMEAFKEGLDHHEEDK